MNRMECVRMIVEEDNGTMVLESQRSPKRKVVTQFLDYLDK